MSFDRSQLAEMGYEDVLLLDPIGLDKAIVGISSDDRAVYDYDKLVEAFCEVDNMTEEEAVEWIDYNVLRSLPYYPNSPVIMNNLNEIM